MAIGKKEATLNDVAEILRGMAGTLDRINEKLDLIVSSTGDHASSDDMLRILKAQKERPRS